MSLGPLPDVGSVLSQRYLLKQTLGRGASAVVYQATDLVLDQTVAIKLLLLDGLNQSDLARQIGATLRAEAKAAMRLSHPGILRVFNYECDAPWEYLVMEFVVGENLSDYRKRQPEGRLTVDETVRWGMESAKALAYAHAQGIVHHDIKPHNIMLTRAGRVKICDFGLARMAGMAWREGSNAGTPAFLSPERITGGEGDQRSDLYSLAASLYLLGNGKAIYGNRPEQALRGHCLLPVPPSPHLPPAVHAVLERALAKLPRDRFNNAREMYDALAQAASTAAPPAREDAPSEIGWSTALHSVDVLAPRRPVTMGGAAGPPQTPLVTMGGAAGPPQTPLGPAQTPPVTTGAAGPLGPAQPPLGPAQTPLGSDAKVGVAGPAAGAMAPAGTPAVGAKAAAPRPAARALATAPRPAAGANAAAPVGGAKVGVTGPAAGAKVAVAGPEASAKAAAAGPPQTPPGAAVARGAATPRPPSSAAAPESRAPITAPPPAVITAPGSSRIRPAMRPKVPAEMVVVPACTVISAYDGEYPIDTFAIDRHPVTNERYLAFLKATGAPAPGHWRKGLPPQDRLRHPVVGITLEEAERFARFEGCRLPTCVEWEAAARSPDGRVFPWGDDWDPGRCHGPERSRGDTAPVDRYSQGASPAGCVDLVGNVWEWTELDERVKPQEPGAVWVLGGSYSHPCAKSGAIARTSVSARKAYLYLGFRCAWSEQGAFE